MSAVLEDFDNSTFAKLALAAANMNLLTLRSNIWSGSDFFNGYFIRHDGAGNMYAKGQLTAGISGTWFTRDAGSHH